jgi:hypothetical protein
MMDTKITEQPAMTGFATDLFKSVLAAVLGAACTLVVMARSTAPASPRTGPLHSAIVSYEGSPWPVELAIGDNLAAPVDSPGPEAAQYMLVTCLSLVGLLSWRINQLRLGGAFTSDILRRVTDTQQGGRSTSDARLKAR